MAKGTVRREHNASSRSLARAHATIKDTSQLKGKGKLEVGSDADILLLDKNTLKLKSVLAKGRIVMTPKWTHQGMFGVSNAMPKQRVQTSAEKKAHNRKWLTPGCPDPNCC